MQFYCHVFKSGRTLHFFKDFCQIVLMLVIEAYQPTSEHAWL